MAVPGAGGRASRLRSEPPAQAAQGRKACDQGEGLDPKEAAARRRDYRESHVLLRLAALRIHHNDRKRLVQRQRARCLSDQLRAVFTTFGDCTPPIQT